MSETAIKIDVDVPIMMRDGVVLRADVYRPYLDERYPTLVIRMPYNKSLPRYHVYFDPIRVVKSGYVVIWQDCRGTMTSEGEFYPVTAEAHDGYDTLEWVANQVWSNGKVGMYGMSYHGLVQLAAASEQAPGLKAIFPAMIGHGIRDLLYRGGAFQLHAALFLSFHLSLLAIARQPRPSREIINSMESLIHAFDHVEDYAKYTPLKQLPVLRDTGFANYYFDWLEHFDHDDYWKSQEFVTYEKVMTPAYFVTGWYDIQLHGTLANYTGIQTKGGSEQARKHVKLLVGPWTHSIELGQQVGELNCGLRAAGATIDLLGTQIRWFDHWLKGVSNGISDGSPVRLFVMGENIWRNENEWPLARTQYTEYYLHSAGHANTMHGNGMLDTRPPGDESYDTYSYNPEDPVLTHGGAMLSFSDAGVGALDQSATDNRSDVLVYTSAVLETPLEVTGPITFKLFAESSAPDTDFTVKLEDVWPNGKSYILADGIIRARYRLAEKQQHFIAPGEVYEYTIDLGATSNLFRLGHRIRVALSSSNFPKYDRNPNTGHALGESGDTRIAHQRIFHDHKRPSHILLPVIPR